MHRYLFLITLLIVCLHTAQAGTLSSALALRQIYAQQVDRKLEIPAQEQSYYAEQIGRELLKSWLLKLPPQYLLLVDRNPQVQAVMLFWLSESGTAEFIGASPISTGRDYGYKHFETPLGLFDHAAANIDFRAEGTRNGYGIMGFGAYGMRVYDFGWVTARQSWRQGTGQMRLLIHSTDPGFLEPLLGAINSMGCIRIPATLNKLIDHYGLLDAGYERALAKGKPLWLLPPDREPTPWTGRYMIIIDSNRAIRPNWSPSPAASAVPPTSAVPAIGPAPAASAVQPSSSVPPSYLP